MNILDRLMAVDVDAIPHDKVNYDQTPVRLLKSDFLERFTHVTPQAVLAIWLPVVAFFLVSGALHWPAEVSPLWFLAAFLFGVALLWTFLEYVVHRFVFHFRPRNRTQWQLIFLFHGVHHYQPHIKTRLVMPPAVSIPGAILFYFLFYLVLDVILGMPFLVAPMFAGTVLGYVGYDMIHYATHHLPAKGSVMKFLKRHHMEHHYKTPDARFGVSTSLWDQVFHTEPDDASQPSRRRA
ncbi:MAG: sterol desaturase family protein [Anaerolineae bacterium]|nr:sterol desaturase family protein [Candidatus Roseilinea sp.]MDW8449007.1 sterol desaturase family protein [Anaerolineae bacterium]